MTRPATVAIRLSALRHNFRHLQGQAPDSRMMAVIKADAYGHGLVRIAEALPEADGFGIACMEEAQCLREAGIKQRLLVLEGPFSADEIRHFQQLDVDMMIHHPAQLEMLAATPIDGQVRIWLKIDTGMHRLGFDPGQAVAASQQLDRLGILQEPPILVTHLASANERDDRFVLTQLDCFEQSIAGLHGQRSIANSAGLLGWPQTHVDWVRPGIALYGISPFTDSTGSELGLQPVMSLQTELIAVRRLAAGESVGYGRAWRCPEPMPVGVVAMGYGDGYPRHARPGTPVLVNGQRAALIGRPSMDMLTVDLRAVPDARVGDPVTLWGEGLPAEEVARHADTIPYELLCNVGRRSRIEITDC